jgi:flagellar basal body-associated protein FliL
MKIKNILGKVVPILKAIKDLLIIGLVLFMAYMLFAPDTWPKPFYLDSYTPAPASGSDQNQAENPVTSNQTVTQPHVTPTADGRLLAPLEIEAGQGITIDTGSKIINLVDPTGRKYLRVGISLEFAPTDLRYYSMDATEKAAFVTAFNEDFAKKAPIINDVIIGTISNKTFEEVYTAEGKNSLKKEIIETLNTKIPEFRVIFVYFTEFVLQ